MERRRRNKKDIHDGNLEVTPRQKIRPDVSPCARRRSSRLAERKTNKGKEENEIIIKKSRVSKRWIFFSVVLTLLFSWAFFPYLRKDQLQSLRLSSLAELLFEGALLSKLFPDGFLGDDFFLKNITNILEPFWLFGGVKDEEYSPGKILRNIGVKGKYPVVMIPGVTSTGLELWEGLPCAKPYFRHRLWGTLTMMRFMLMDSSCWLQHLQLDPETGDDPANIKLRAAQGLEAADFLLPGFWVWARMIENLSEIGYDNNNLLMAAYDWRVDINTLEKRDHYFSKLKSQIEHLVIAQGEKVVALSHSLGSIIWYYFIKWVEHTGNDKTWVNRHVHASVTIGAPWLGVPKAMSMIISGEMRDTAQMGQLESTLLEMLMSKKERLALFRTWSGGFAMLPKGGNNIWGGPKGSEIVDATISDANYGIVNILKEGEDENKQNSVNCTWPLKSTYYTNDIDILMDEYLPPGIRKIIKETYSNGSIASPSAIAKNDQDPRTWTNPLQARLPYAPDTKIYCFYGYGKETERGYLYEPVMKSQWPESLREGSNEILKKFIRSSDKNEILIRMKLKLDAADPKYGLRTGIYHVNGDGTVPLISNGFMCAHAWKEYTHLNPSNTTIITREYLHEPKSGLGSLRGGPKTSDHVDILGNHQMTFDILKIVSGFSQEGSITTPGGEVFNLGEVEEKISSNIRQISKKINLGI